MTEPVLIKDLQNQVLILRLNRPEKKNALSAELTSAIVEAIDRFSCTGRIGWFPQYPAAEEEKLQWGELFSGGIQAPRQDC